jgi:hypothetical protein
MNIYHQLKLVSDEAWADADRVLARTNYEKFRIYGHTITIES